MTLRSPIHSALLAVVLLTPLAALATGETGGIEEAAPANPEAPDLMDAAEPAVAPEPAMDEPAPMGAVPPRAAPSGEVTRATFTSAVIEREPIDSIDELSTVTSRVYFFTELVGFEGYTVTHRWEHAGETIAEVPFHVNGPRWRVYSSKALLPGWIGAWSVVVVDESGNELARRSMQYTEAPAPLRTPPPVPEPAQAMEPPEPTPTPAVPESEPTVPSAPEPVDAAPAPTPAVPSIVEEEVEPAPPLN